ncbi:MAG: hypothetical protein AABZ60_20905 [Planctomycetota bacterium]
MDSKFKVSLTISLAILLLMGCGGGSSKKKPSDTSISIDTDDSGTKQPPTNTGTGSGTNTTTKNPTKTPSNGSEDASSATQLDPNASTYAKQGESLMKQEKTEAAVNAWEQGLQTKSDDTNCLFCMGQYYWEEGAESEATEYFRKLYEAKPSDNLKKQVGRIFKRPIINDYDELTAINGQRSDKKEKQKQLGDLVRLKREYEAEAKNFERRDEMDLAAQFKMKAEEVDAQIKALENQ